MARYGFVQLCRCCTGLNIDEAYCVVEYVYFWTTHTHTNTLTQVYANYVPFLCPILLTWPTLIQHNP